MASAASDDTATRKVPRARLSALFDLSPVAALPDLRLLFLSDNDIMDLSPLAGLTELTQTGPYRVRAREVASAIDAEDGVSRAVERVETAGR